MLYGSRSGIRRCFHIERKLRDEERIKCPRALFLMKQNDWCTVNGEHNTCALDYAINNGTSRIPVHIYCRFGWCIAQKRQFFHFHSVVRPIRLIDTECMRLSTYWLSWFKNFQTDQKGRNGKTEQITNKIKRTWIEEKKNGGNRNQNTNGNKLPTDWTNPIWQAILFNFIGFVLFMLHFRFIACHSQRPTRILLSKLKLRTAQMWAKFVEGIAASLKKKPHPQIKQMYSLWYFPFSSFFPLRPFELLPFIWIVLLLCWHSEIYDNLYSIRVKDVTIKMYKCQRKTIMCIQHSQEPQDPLKWKIWH